MTAIEWTDETWNPVTGCSKVSPGCAHCYAEALSRFVLDAVLDERDWATQSGRARYQENLFGEPQTPPGRKLRWRRDL